MPELRSNELTHPHPSHRSTSTRLTYRTSIANFCSASPTSPSPRPQLQLRPHASSTRNVRSMLGMPTSRTRRLIRSGSLGSASYLALSTIWVRSVKRIVRVQSGGTKTMFLMFLLLLDARRHVNKMCLTAGVPLIESGTAGFAGQVQPIIPVSAASIVLNVHSNTHIDSACLTGPDDLLRL